MKGRFSLLIAGILLFSSFYPNDPLKIDSSEKKFIIDTLGTLLQNNYVFPEVGLQIADQLKSNLTQDKYSDVNDYRTFSEIITNDLRSVNGDKHLALIYAPDVIKSLREDEGKDTKKLEEEFLGVRKRRNFGFFNIEIMDGNVGYLRLDNFYDVKQAGETAVAATQFLANTYAIILDLRYNGGGNGNMVKLLSTYFIGDEPQHLNTFYSRKEDKYYQSWSLPFVPGKSLADKDLYILTSSNTFSAAEEFCYNLKNMGRAVLIGEVTGGGAHPISRHILNDNFGVQLAIGRSINPITETNWEGVGVEPDIIAEDNQAKDVAYLTALKKLSTNKYPENFQDRLDFLIKKNEVHPSR